MSLLINGDNQLRATRGTSYSGNEGGLWVVGKAGDLRIVLHLRLPRTISPQKLHVMTSVASASANDLPAMLCDGEANRARLRDVL